MTIQLSKAQIDALKCELAKYGLHVTVARRPKQANQSDLARIRAWKPETAAGRACKSNMLWLASLPPIRGVYDYKVRGMDGKWYSESDGALFDAAKEYQAKKHADLCKRGFIAEQI